MISQNLPNRKPDTLPNKSIDMVLKPSEKRLLRQDLHQAVAFSEGYFAKRA